MCIVDIGMSIDSNQSNDDVDIQERIEESGKIILSVTRDKIQYDMEQIRNRLLVDRRMSGDI